MPRREMRKNPGEVIGIESLNMAVGRYFARRALALDAKQKIMRIEGRDPRSQDLVEILPVLEAAADAFAVEDHNSAHVILEQLQLSQRFYEEFNIYANVYAMQVRVMAHDGVVVHVSSFSPTGFLNTPQFNFFAQEYLRREGLHGVAHVKQLPPLHWGSAHENVISYSRKHPMSSQTAEDFWYEDLDEDNCRANSDDFILGWYMEIVEKTGDANLRIGRGENLDMKSNPAWATKVVAHTYGEIEAKVDPKWLPKLDGIGARGNQLLGKLKELGCGAYGCVYPTGDDSIVLKITTDTTEADFARDLAADLVTPVTVHYHQVIDADAAYKNRPVFFLWREEAKKVGKIHKEPNYGKRARELIYAQHLAAQAAYELMGHRMKAYKSIVEATTAWRSAAEDMGEVPALRFLARGMIEVLDKNKIFFGDVHEGNLGIVTRNGEQVWAITDPGHVAVVNW